MQLGAVASSKSLQQRRYGSWASLSSHEQIVNSCCVQKKKKSLLPQPSSSPYATARNLLHQGLTPCLVSSHTTHTCMLTPTSAEASSDTILPGPIWTCCTHHHIRPHVCAAVPKTSRSRMLLSRLYLCMISSFHQRAHLPLQLCPSHAALASHFSPGCSRCSLYSGHSFNRFPTLSHGAPLIYSTTPPGTRPAPPAASSENATARCGCAVCAVPELVASAS